MTDILKEQQFSRFSQRGYRVLLFLLIISGVAASGYLAVSHYRNFTDIGYQSFCAISRALNCDTVSQSPYAVFAGAPLAIWGAVGYLLLLAMMFFFGRDKTRSRGWAALVVLAAFYCVVSICLAIISSVWVHSYCLLCISTYVVNFAILYFSWLASRRFGAKAFYANLKKDVALLQEKSGQTIFAVTAFAGLMVCIASFYPDYWHFPVLSTNVEVSTGVTEEGHPWIGAQQPELTIVEFADYMCFQCGKMHTHLRRLVNQYPHRIRLVHRHFPLDKKVNPIVKEQVHSNAGLISLFAIFAQESGKFWPVNDLLFQEAREKKAINFSKIAQKTGLDISNLTPKLNDGPIITKLERDIRAGLKLGITSTPSYLIDGKLYSGTIPENILAGVLKQKTKGNPDE